MKSKNRLLRKLDAIFWFVMMCLPIIAYFFTYFQNPHSSGDFLTYVEAWRFPFIADIFESVFSTSGFGTFAIVDLISYVVGVEIIHVLFDVIVFIPRLCHKFINFACQND